MELQHFLLSLIVIYASARLLGEAAARIGQPAVLGELLAGMLVGGSALGWIEPTETLKLLGEVGIILLMFEVGLESDLRTFLHVARSATAVAVVGMVIPFLLGYGLSLGLHLSQLQALFIGVTLTPTSVAIPARVLSELGKLNTAESNILLGAAVVDDILALVALSVIVDLVESGQVSWLHAGESAGLALLFLGVAIAIGIKYAHWFSRLINQMITRGRLIVAAVTFAMLLGYAAAGLHLAPLVGAFAAGLVLARTEHRAHIEERIKPVADIFVPIFFVLVGATVDLRYLNPFDSQNWPSLVLAAGLFVVATVGKFVSGWAATGPDLNRTAIGVGMVPRGEVVLIFASLGLSRGIIGQGVFGAVLLVILGTTVLAPVALQYVYRARPSGACG